MYKTILFPTDFTVRSLNLVKKAIEDHPGEKLDILLIHGIHSSDSITDLLFFSKGKIIQKLSSLEFEDACQLLSNIFKEQVNSIKTELFTGFTQSGFNEFVKDLKVDTIYLPVKSDFVFRNKMSADLTRFLIKNTSTKVFVQEHAEKIEMNRDHKMMSHISYIK